MKERITRAGNWLAQNRTPCILLAAGCAAEGLFLLLRQDRAAMDRAASLAMGTRQAVSAMADPLPFSLPKRSARRWGCGCW